MPVPKRDGKSIRICEDFKHTTNRVSKLDRYLIPKPEDLFTSLVGGQSFTKLDMSQAYQQICLVEHSRKYMVINTHQGVLQYNKLPFGVASAPRIFQCVMKCVLDFPLFIITSFIPLLFALYLSAKKSCCTVC